MYVYRKLIAEFNEQYFRHFQSTGLKALPKTNNKRDSKVLDVVDHNVRYYFENQDIIGEELYNVLRDIRTVVADKLYMSLKLKSTLSKLLYCNISNFSLLIKNNVEKTSDTTKQVINILNSISYNNYIVGGFIRDSLSKRVSKDVDFVTGTPIDLLVEVFENYGFTVKHEGKQFLVCIVSKNGEFFEIANFRKDKDNSGGVIGTIEEDAFRRDFTINALYFGTFVNELNDPTGLGIDDIMSGTLRFIGNSRDRIIEDPLRVMRFYRFVSNGFKPDTGSLRAVRQNFEYCVKNASSERIRTELERIINIKGNKDDNN